MNPIFIVSPLMGGVIGYFTNWLAIKMLFRPHKKMYIGNLPIPFTPGLIPKERTRIAKSVADAVGDNLLNPDFLAKEAVAPDKIIAIENFLIGKREALLKSDYKVGDIFNILFKDAKEANLKIISSYFASQLTNRDYWDKHIDEVVAKVLNEFLWPLLKDNQFKTSLSSCLLNAIQKEPRCLKELLPKSILWRIPELSQKITQKLIFEIEKYVKRPETKDLIKKQIDIYLQSSPFKWVIGKFVNSAALAHDASQALVSFLKEPTNEEYIAKVIREKADEFLEKKPQELILLVGQDNVINGIDNGLEMILNSIPWSNLINKEKLLDFLETEKVRVGVERIIYRLFVQLEEIKLNKIVSSVGPTSWNKMQARLISIYQEKAPSFLVTVFEQFNLAKVIEDKINAFDLIELEEMLLVLMDKELAAITWLGGLLGLIMGFLTPLVNMLF